jgi:hypothetical protein
VGDNFLHPSDAIQLSSTILQRKPCNFYDGGDSLLTQTLQILVLNRKGSRKMINIKNVLKYLNSYNISQTQHNDINVSLVAFEKLTFINQVGAMIL